MVKKILILVYTFCVIQGMEPEYTKTTTNKKKSQKELTKLLKTTARQNRFNEDIAASEERPLSKKQSKESKETSIRKSLSNMKELKQTEAKLFQKKFFDPEIQEEEISDSESIIIEAETTIKKSKKVKLTQKQKLQKWNDENNELITKYKKIKSLIDEVIKAEKPMPINHFFCDIFFNLGIPPTLLFSKYTDLPHLHDARHVAWMATDICFFGKYINKETLKNNIKTLNNMISKKLIPEEVDLVNLFLFLMTGKDIMKNLIEGLEFQTNQNQVDMILSFAQSFLEMVKSNDTLLLQCSKIYNANLENPAYETILEISTLVHGKEKKNFMLFHNNEIITHLITCKTKNIKLLNMFIIDLFEKYMNQAEYKNKISKSHCSLEKRNNNEELIISWLIEFKSSQKIKDYIKVNHEICLPHFMMGCSLITSEKEYNSVSQQDAPPENNRPKISLASAEQISKLISIKIA